MQLFAGIRTAGHNHGLNKTRFRRNIAPIGMKINGFSSIPDPGAGMKKTSEELPGNHSLAPFSP
ncbi:MAG: hypothetical protein KDJ69_09775 [Nitratireductor sp.]|nr:hypothetical protein [Nitratireductor sp.]